jgi:hypothetical protein
MAEYVGHFEQAVSFVTFNASIGCLMNDVRGFASSFIPSQPQHYPFVKGKFSP